MNSIFQNKNFLIKSLKIFLAIFFIIPITLVIIFFVFEKKYENKIYPNVYIGNIALGGKTTDQALMIINQKIDELNQNGIIFKFDYFQATFLPLISSIEGDLTYKTIHIDTESTINQAYDFARSGDFKKDLKIKLNNFYNKKTFDIIGKLEEDKIKEFLINNFSRFGRPAEDATLIYHQKTKKQAAYFEVIEEKYGQNINFNQSINQLKKNINFLDYSNIELKQIIEQPNIYKKDCLNIDSQAKSILSLAPITFTYKEKEWNLNEEDLITWLTLEKTNKNKIIVGLKNEKIIEYLKTLAKDIDIEPTAAKFEMTEQGKVNEFQLSKDGLKLNINKTLKIIKEQIATSNLATIEKNNKIELYTQIIKSNITTNKLDELGIKEIIGTGNSKQVGSSANRRHNIRTGAIAINGLLIKPNEEFSLISALGAVNKENGYLPELVIKDNKTIPEYGGGLCQIGTTLFRTVINAGLPVTMRRNHSYRVSYYEPAGTDATIYDPLPDFRFINDTGKHILIQTYVDDKNNNVWFDFWGTKDGRVATNTYPVIYNITKPQETKIIETTELDPGIKKCTEHAHNGADAYFDYTVTYQSGEIKKERFKSHYSPWREVCLLGIEKEEIASSSIDMEIKKDQL